MQGEPGGQGGLAIRASDDRAADASRSGPGASVDGMSESCSMRLIDAGAYPPALNALRLTLERHGALRNTTNEIALIATADYLDPKLHSSVRDALSGFRWVLPARLGRATIWLGPLIDADSAIRFSALLRRLSENRPAAFAALRCRSSFPLPPPLGLRGTYDLASAWIASALAVLSAGALPPAVLEGVLTLDPWTLETRRHPILIHQSVPRCHDDERAPVELAASPKRYWTDGGHRSVTPDQTLARLEPLVSPITGLVPDITKVPAPEPIHLYAAAQVLGSEATGHGTNRAVGGNRNAIGKGASDLQAKVSCLAEAVERYSCGYFGDEPQRHCRIDQLRADARHPANLLQFSATQYENRGAINTVRGRGCSWIPTPFDPKREIGWTPAWSLTFERAVWLPSAFCYFLYPGPADHEFCVADSNGCAAGNTLEEAILQGFLELVERDACALWWYNRLRRPGIDLASFSERYFDDMVAAMDRRGRELVAIDLTTDLGITVVVAVSWQRFDGGRIHMGFGSHLEPRLAIARAMSELNQFIGSDPTGGDENAAYEGFHGVDVRHWLCKATLENQPYLRPASGSCKRRGDFHDHSTDDLCDDVAWCVERLRAKDLEMIVLDHTRAEIGFPVVRVIVPGLRHSWERLGPGRLYEVPVALGWLDRPLPEAAMNPIPYFL